MAPPTVTHKGLIVPNAVGSPDPILAEPDRIDYNTATHARWGVIEGCAVTASGPKGVFVGTGSAIVDGKFVVVISRSLQLSTPSANARFDLVVVDEKGEPSVLQGEASTRPIFPDPGLDQTVLASVYCKAGVADFGDYIVDKRKFLSPALLTKINPDEELIRNYDEEGAAPGEDPQNYIVMLGDGKMIWSNDTTLERDQVNRLRVGQDLFVQRSIGSDNHTAKTLVQVTDGPVRARNLRNTPSTSGTPDVSIGALSDLWQDTATGRVFIRRRGPISGYVWEEIATTESAVPVGTIITSLQTPSEMEPLGWYPLDGRTLTENAESIRLFNLAVFQATGAITGTAPNRSLKLPNMSRRVMLTDFNFPGRTGGSYPNNIISLSWINLPPHHHSVNVQPGGAIAKQSWTTPLSGAHNTHTVSGGWHDHAVYDPGHRHESMDWDGIPRPVIAVMEGGQNKIDALFNDRSHTYSVEPVRWTMKAITGINIQPSEQHGHSIAGGLHAHPVEFGPIAAHDHVVSQAAIGGNEQGRAEPIDITPQYLTVMSYIRS